MTILDKMNTLKNYYEFTRQKGHTFLAVYGSPSHLPCIIITHNQDSAKRIKKQYDLPDTCKFVTINSLETLRGYDLPIIIDNAALYSLFDEVIKQLTKQGE